MARTFSSLSPQQALHLAILVEDRNADIYQRYASMFSEFGDAESAEVASVFWDMSVEEKRHGALLRTRYEERYPGSPCSLTEEDLLEMIEVPRLDASSLFDESSPDLPGSRQRAIRVALDAEKSAQSFYGQLIPSASDDELRRLYVELATMEDGHVTFLRGMLAGTVPADAADVN